MLASISHIFRKQILTLLFMLAIITRTEARCPDGEAMTEWTQRPIDAPTGDMFTGEEVARLLGVSRDTLDRWIADGEFPCGLRHGKQAVVWDWQSVAFYRLKLAMSPRLFSEKPSATGGKPSATGGKGSASDSGP